MNYYVENHISPNEVRPDEKYEKVLEKLNNLKSESDLIVIVISKYAPGVYGKYNIEFTLAFSFLSQVFKKIIKGVTHHTNT